MIGVAAAQQWQASVVAVLALLVAALIRGRWPRAAAAIVLLALIKFLLPPLVAVPSAVFDRLAAEVRPFEPAKWVNAPPAAGALVWPGVVSGMWVTGAFLVFAGGAIRRSGFYRRIRQGRRVHDGPLLALATEIGAALGQTRLPRLVLADVDGPYAIGLREPTIVLPRSYGERLDASRRARF